MEHQPAHPTWLAPQKKSNPTRATPQEENQPAAYPTCALKVNINCCNGCEVKAKKKLQKLKGVDSITYDAEQGIVRISGNVNPTVVIHKLAELGKKAELLRLDDKNPVQIANTKNPPTNGAACASDDHGGDVPIPTNSQSSNNKTFSKKWFWCFSRKNKQVKTSSTNADGGANNVSTKLQGAYGGANNVSTKFQRPGVTNFPGYVAPTAAHVPAPAPATASGPYYMPPMHSMPMPPYMVPPHNGFLRPRPPPMTNPMIHYTNYEDNHRDFL
ncbi:hypothetical protein Dsin_025192 [Dipteronia sinensis]|uniref:HMA domain-containing protein n=1 Tax=Dipteronia sinensis TaxID=43782 RepID=A0AAD9ZVD7_9ROSI|nr:hypothetical protein Dsin_025192 [Dipteronia sinensis]